MNFGEGFEQEEHGWKIISDRNIFMHWGESRWYMAQAYNCDLDLFEDDDRLQHLIDSFKRDEYYEQRLDADNGWQQIANESIAERFGGSVDRMAQMYGFKKADESRVQHIIDLFKRDSYFSEKRAVQRELENKNRLIKQQQRQQMQQQRAKEELGQKNWNEEQLMISLQSFSLTENESQKISNEDQWKVIPGKKYNHIFVCV